MAELIPIKITIRRGNKQIGEDAMVYPTGHNGSVVDVEGIGMHYGKTEQIGLGSEFEYAVTAIPQWYLDQLVIDGNKAGETGLITVLTEVQAEKFFTDHVPEDTEVINDKSRIDLLIAKKQLGVTLTVEELKSIDPADAAPGIINNPRKGFKKKLGGNTIKVA